MERPNVLKERLIGAELNQVTNNTIDNKEKKIWFHTPKRDKKLTEC